MAAIVLAAGESRRMGFPKALLPIAGHTFVEHIVRALAAAGYGGESPGRPPEKKSAGICWQSRRDSILLKLA